MLALRPDQMRGVEAARIERLKRRLCVYLRKTADVSFGDGNSGEVEQIVESSVRSALQFQFRKEASYRRWTYLMHVSKGRVGKQLEILTFIRDGRTPAHVSRSGTPVPDNADDRMTSAFEQTVAFFKRASSNPSGSSH